jgi:hypothetical protein
MTELTLRLDIIRAFAISFIANSFFSLRSSTFHTLPKPPRPTTYWKLKWFLFIAKAVSFIQKRAQLTLVSVFLGLGFKIAVSHATNLNYNLNSR